MPTVVPSRVTRNSSSRDVARQAEVRHLHDQLAVLAGQQEVGRLDVAVDDALPVGVVEGLRRLDEDGAGLRDFEPALAEDVVGEVRPVDELHRQVVGIVDLVPLVQGDDVGVVEPGGVAGLAAEAFEGAGVVEEAGGKHLESNDAAEADVHGLVDGAHAASGDVRQHLVFSHAGGG